MLETFRTSITEMSQSSSPHNTQGDYISNPIGFSGLTVSNESFTRDCRHAAQKALLPKLSSCHSQFTPSFCYLACHNRIKMQSVRCCIKQIQQRLPPAAALTKTLTRSFGSRGSRGHGWYVKYRAGEGGRHLQGEYHDRDSLEECQAWNASVLGLGSTRIYMDVVVEPKKTSAAAETVPGMATVPPLDGLTAPVQRLEFDMATAVMPATCHNFATLITNQEYNGTLLYRFEKEVGLCGGDILTNTGKTGRSHRQDRLTVNVHETDPLAMWHLPGTVSMLVSTVQEIDSRFFFCTSASPHLDGIHRAFGQLTPESLTTVQDWQSKILTRGGGIPTTYDIIVVEAGLSDKRGDNVDVTSINASGTDASTAQATSMST